MDQTPARSKKRTTLRSSLRAFMAAATRMETMKNQKIPIADAQKSTINAMHLLEEHNTFTSR